MIGEIRIPLDRNCVSPDNKDAVIYAGSIGQIVGLIAHEMKKRGSDLCIAGTSDLHEIAISGRSLSTLQQVVLRPEMQLILQAVSSEESKLVPLDSATYGLTSAVKDTKHLSTWEKFAHQALMRGDEQGARRIREQKHISQRRIAHNLKHVAQTIPGNTLEEKLRNYIGKSLDIYKKEQHIVSDLPKAESL